MFWVKRYIFFTCLFFLFCPGAKRVQDVDALWGEKGAQLAAKTMGSGETSLGDALWCCANLFSDIKLRLAQKQLMIFTCRDNPHGGDSVKDRQARTKASDLKETGGSRLKAALLSSYTVLQSAYNFIIITAFTVMLIKAVNILNRTFTLLYCSLVIY